MNAYVPILGMVVLALAFVLIMIGLNVVFAPKRYNRAKHDTYECGIEPTPQPAQGGRVSIKYYVIAMLYIVFDVAMIFLYPWAVSFNQMNFFLVMEMIVFMVAVLIGYLYVYRRGGLEWD